MAHRRRRSPTTPPPKPPPPPVARRLLHRVESAQYLSVSLAAFDTLVAQGQFTHVPVPAVRTINGGRSIPALTGAGELRTKLFDIRDLDAAIERWKAERL